MYYTCMHIVINTRHSKQNLYISTQQEKAALREKMLELPLDEFKSAVVDYGDDNMRSFRTVKELLDELGKPY